MAIHHNVGTTSIATYLLGILCLLPSLVMVWSIKGVDAESWITPVLCIAIPGYAITRYTIPLVATKMPTFLAGKDLCKKGTPFENIRVPEALGIVSGLLFVLCMILIRTVLVDSPENTLLHFSVAIIVIFAMIALGFADDYLNLQWRYKLLFPPLASIFLLMTYNGSTSVLMPKQVWSLLADDTLLHTLLTPFLDIATRGDVINLGVLYLVYMVLLAVFCTNAINIYAGINGLEAGQVRQIQTIIMQKVSIMVVICHCQCCFISKSSSNSSWS